jgi:hypothetical protein
MKFDLGDEVTIDTRAGTVIGRSEFSEQPSVYLVRCRDKREDWFNGDELESADPTRKTTTKGKKS